MRYAAAGLACEVGAVALAVLGLVDPSRIVGAAGLVLMGMMLENVRARMASSVVAKQEAIDNEDDRQ
ncbi:MAG TPA: hypothetical protein VIQ30_18600 [Pseudonocardia sp.]